MPAAEVRATPEVIARGDIPASWDYDTLRPVAAHFGVSAEAFLRRLSTLGLVPVDLYRQRRAESSPPTTTKPTALGRLR